MRGIILGMSLAATTAGLARAGPHDLSFKLSYSRTLTSEPGLKAWLDGYAQRLRARRQREAAADPTRSGAALIPYRLAGRWQREATLPRFVSLSADIVENEGGIHDNERFDGIIWDRRVRTARTALSFFKSPAAFRKSVLEIFCRRLKEQRHVSATASGDRAYADGCPAPEQLTILLGSSNRRQFTQIRILMEHMYTLDGDEPYDVNVPVTSAVVAAVKSEWRAYFMPDDCAPHRRDG